MDENDLLNERFANLSAGSPYPNRHRRNPRQRQQFGVSPRPQNSPRKPQWTNNRNQNVPLMNSNPNLAQGSGSKDGHVRRTSNWKDQKTLMNSNPNLAHGSGSKDGHVRRASNWEDQKTLMNSNPNLAHGSGSKDGHVRRASNWKDQKTLMNSNPNLTQGPGSKDGHVRRASNWEDQKTLMNSNSNLTHGSGSKDGHVRRASNWKDQKNFPKNTREKRIGFKFLEETSMKNPEELLLFLSEKDNIFEAILKEDHKLDSIILVCKCLAKLCLAEFDQMKVQCLLDTCKSKFMETLKNYIFNLPYTKSEDKKINKYFWNDVDDFFENVLYFYMMVIELLPSTAADIFQPFLDTIETSIDRLKKYHDEKLSDDTMKCFENIQNKLAICIADEERKAAQSLQVKKEYNYQKNIPEMTPPEDFREIPIMPTKDDLFNPPEFLRPHIIEGAFKDVEHYLDVQFRLMREDFIAPMREAISMYRSKDGKKRISGAKFYKNAKIMNHKVNRGILGVDICFDQKLYNNAGKNKKKKENHFQSKRFLFGSLLCLTKDDFENIIFCTVNDRTDIASGVVMAEIDNEIMADDHMFNGSYLMIECEVYFPPYLHVLQALQRPQLATKFPFKDYIIYCQNLHDYPLYLENTNELKLFDNKSVNIANDALWPGAQQLGFDESQFTAYKMAMTREFVTIQGPPGTGKTFIGLKIAETLLKNHYLTKGSPKKPPILVVSYTNHALDQFLEGLLPITQELIRIGGQSKNEAVSQFNLNQVRRKRNRNYYKHMDNLRETSTVISKLQQNLKVIRNRTEVLDVTKHERILNMNFDNFFSDFNFNNLAPVLNWLMLAEDSDPKLKNVNTQVDASQNNDSDDDTSSIYSDAEDIHREALDLDDDFDSTPEKHNSGYSIEVLTEYMVTVENELNNNTALTEQEFNKLNSDEQILRNRLNLLKDQLQKGREGYAPVNNSDLNAKHYTLFERWGLYWQWLQIIEENSIKKLTVLSEKYVRQKKLFEELTQTADLSTLQSAHVVGITTSGASKLQSLLRALHCPIVIVEEAAEVMESHVVVSLTDYCQHLIMIGDHQQLRPITATYQMAKKFHLDISLFERMVTNGHHCHQLTVQHRMRPEIAKLITPAIYPVLYNNSTVNSYPNVKGVVKNLFFINHQEPETMIEELSSRSNKHEAMFVLCLAKYFIQQGYTADKITIVATYSGQMLLLRQERKKFKLLENVRISVLDNFQGEENDIILLSLVRSNREENIGFLSTVNRVCVALSRAKHGFYIVGNMTILKKKSDLWDNVNSTLSNQDSIGPNLELCCEIHKTKTMVKTEKDFENVPEGGCKRLCESLLECGHYCKKICHTTDRAHEFHKCMEKCTRILCNLGHACPSFCYMTCGPCKILVERTLTCSHKANLPCHENPLKAKCLVPIDVVLPLCQHKVIKYCYQTVNEVVCPEACMDRLPCGHACVNKCHKKKDPHHLEYECLEDCGRLNQGCSQKHPCKKRCHEECSLCTEKVEKRRNCTHKELVKCHEDINEIPCKNKCKRAMTCGHYCKSLCFEKCDENKCETMVMKTRSCGHQIRIKCSQNPNTLLCVNRCTKILSCGHLCTKRCSESCDISICTELIANPYSSLCTHYFQIPCKERNHESDIGELVTSKYCTQPCGALLKGCSHRCKGTCGQCSGGTLHVPCSEPCGNMLMCGHICEDPCREACPPCKKPCEVRCKHSKCTFSCGVPCPPCKQPCVRKCDHWKCKNNCGNECSTPPCSEPCSKTLPCGHPCRGLCGEECPNICHICKPEEFPEIFFGPEDEEDAIFVKLSDCPHVVEVNSLDTWIKNTQDDNLDRKISIKSCPHCLTRIINTPRYSDYVKLNQKDIEKAKRKVFGDFTEVRIKIVGLNEDITSFETNERKIKAVNLWVLQLNTLKNSVQKNIQTLNAKNKQSILRTSLLDVNKQILQFDILKNIAKLYEELQDKNSVFVEHLMTRLLEAIQLFGNKISEQQSYDISNEIARFEKLIQAKNIQMSIEFKSSYNTLFKNSLLKEIKHLVTSRIPFTEEIDNEIKAKLKEFRKQLRMSPLSDNERKMIVQAMGLKLGHWYCCPNGHAYCITECGGAMQVGTCPECNESIGGSSHQLLSSNRVATFMDGSRHAAWSDQNNMGNFLF